MRKRTFLQYFFLLLCLVFIISSEYVNYPLWLMPTFYMISFAILTIKLILLVITGDGLRES